MLSKSNRNSEGRKRLLIYHPPMSGWARVAPLGYENLWTAAGFSGTDAAIVETAKLLAEAGVAEVTVADYLGTDPSDARAYSVDAAGGGTRYAPATTLDVNDFDWYCPLFYTYEPQHLAFLAAIRDRRRTKLLLWAHCPLPDADCVPRWRAEGFHVTVAAPSEWLRRYYVALYGQGVRVVPNGVAPRFFEPAATSSRRRCCSLPAPPALPTSKTRGAWYFPACFARGGAVAVRAFERVRAARPAAASALHMLSYYLPDESDGDGEDAATGVRRHGSQPKARVAAFAAECEYFVHPLAYGGSGAPHHETFSCCILEALAAGAIVVTWAVGCIPSLYGDLVVALPPPPGYAAEALHGAAESWFLSDAAVDALAGAVLALDADPARRAALRSRGMAWARQQTWARSAAALGALLLEQEEQEQEEEPPINDAEQNAREMGERASVAAVAAADDEVPVFTTDWFSGNIPAISQSLELLGPASKVRRILEIGSWEGRSTLWLLQNCPCATIACVDTFEGGSEHQGSGSLFGLEARFRNNVKKYADRVFVHRGISGDALFGVGAPGSFDVAYVDGSHASCDALTDIVLSFQLLRPGGLMLIDDYGGGDPGNLLPTSPRPAVDAFLHIMQSKISVVHFGYQVHLQKK